MTNIHFEIFPYRDGQSCFELTAEGHATGSMPVCAGASAILYTLVAWILNSGSAQADELVMEPGHAVVRFSGGDSAEAVFLSTVLGFQQLAHQYGEYIRVEGNDRRPRTSESG